MLTLSSVSSRSPDSITAETWARRARGDRRGPNSLFLVSPSWAGKCRGECFSSSAAKWKKTCKHDPMHQRNTAVLRQICSHGGILNLVCMRSKIQARCNDWLTCLGQLQAQVKRVLPACFVCPFVCIHWEDSLGLSMEDLRPAESEGPSPIQACQISGKEKKDTATGTHYNLKQYFVVHLCLYACSNNIIGTVLGCVLFFILLFSSWLFVLWGTEAESLTKQLFNESGDLVGIEVQKNRLKDKSLSGCKIKSIGWLWWSTQDSWLMTTTRTETVTDARREGFAERLCWLNIKYFWMIEKMSIFVILTRFN